METTMTENTAINTAATGEPELNEAELNHVSGGSFTYGAIEWTYTKQKPDGSAAGNVAAKWSVAQGAVS
jgi:type VI protein secretion system component Hcp